MATIPTIDQLKRAVHLQENIEKLQNQAHHLQKELSSILGRAGASVLGIVEKGLKTATKGIQSIRVSGKRKISKAGRARIAAAQKKRWAKMKGKASKPARKKRKMSAAGRAAIVAAQKARWAKAKADAGKG